MKKLICLFLFLPIFLQAQQVNVDSLINILKNDKLTAEKEMSLYSNIIDAYFLYDFKETEYYIRKGLDLAEREKNRVMASKFSASFGRFYSTKTNFDSALIYYEKALDNALQAKDKALESRAYCETGIVYGRQGENTTALDYFIKALAIDEELGNKKGCVYTMNNIITLYRGMGNNERAIHYLEKAKIIAEEIEFEAGKMYIYYELGAIYHKIAESGNDTVNIDLMMEYMLKSNELSKKLGSKYNQATTAHALATIYSDFLNDYDKALKYAKESLQLAPETGDPHIVAASWYSVSFAYLRLKQYKEAEEAALKAWEHDSSGNNLGTFILKNIIISNIALGNQDKASMYFKKYEDCTNMKTNQSNREIMADMEVKYETEKKEMRIAALEERQRLYMALGVAVIVVLLLGIGLLYYRHRSSVHKRKMAEQQIKQLEQEKELIITRAVLDAEKAEREIIARDLHDGVGAMLSVVKNNMNIMKSYSIIENKEADYFNKALDGLDKSIVELRRVAHHIMPAVLVERGLFAALDDFCRSVPEAEFHYKNQERRFDHEKELVLYRCAYELVSNALRHARASHIDVHMNMDEKVVYLSVVDNGCGFDPQNIPMGMGIKNIRTRLSAFDGRMEIYSEPENGTEVNVELKIK